MKSEARASAEEERNRMNCPFSDHELYDLSLMNFVSSYSCIHRSCVFMREEDGETV